MEPRVLSDEELTQVSGGMINIHHLSLGDDLQTVLAQKGPHGRPDVPNIDVGTDLPTV